MQYLDVNRLHIKCNTFNNFLRLIDTINVMDRVMILNKIRNVQFKILNPPHPQP